ncbi:SDR family NAD(P)-dependent oxidoreductase [Acrocarpospora pleiomorpha]|uniref:SDR family NAD(P)-dependent oxidoreductase n=1 Tax=Acrocarpospora pleiomorpha TaxID=90975 RepID=UPI00280C029A|nr:SDR family oxidoreductase [Acrocarpospora pleiomorpha]
MGDLARHGRHRLDIPIRHAKGRTVSQATPRVAAVTGGASGIGLGIVRRLVADGWKVVAGDINAVTLNEAFGDSDEENVVGVSCDVSVESHVARLVETAVERFGRLDCMVNNAGISGAFGPIHELDVAHWDFTFGVLARGVFLGTKHATRQFLAQGGGGSIVNMCSIAAWDGGTGPQAYSAAKAAVQNLTWSTAAELAEHRIRVNAVAPGSVITPMWMKGRDQSDVDRALQLQPLKEPTTSEHVAEAVAFLAAPEPAMITGTCVAVDGGISAAGTDLARRLGNNPGDLKISGLNMGTSGTKSVVNVLGD